LLVVAVSLVHASQVRGGAWMQNITVLIKVLLILLFIGLGLNHLPEIPSPNHAPVQIPAFAVSLVWVFFSYCGWNGAIYLGGEIAQPERNLPRALVLGTSLVTLLYLGLNAVFLFSTDTERLSGQLAVGRIAAQALGGDGWEQALTTLIVLALATSASALSMAGPRVYARMAEDGYLPSVLAAPAGPPRVAILFQMVLALVFLWTSSYEGLLTYIGFTLGLSSAATVLGLMRWRRAEGSALPVPGWPWVPSLFILSVLAISGYAALQKPRESGIGLLTLGLGIGMWALTRHNRNFDVETSAN
jgi:APA family basic amino acid/polyamine antiporter